MKLKTSNLKECMGYLHAPKTTEKVQPRSVIAKLSFFQDKELIKSYNRILPKGAKYEVTDDFPKGVDAIRKAFHPKLKQAREEGKIAFSMLRSWL